MPGQAPQPPPAQVMSSNPDAGPPNAEQNDTSAIPHMNPRKSPLG